MATITTRAGKGSPLTNTEVDDNFSNLNSAKYESGSTPTFGNVNIESTTGTAERYISVGSSAIDTSAYAYIDFVGDTTYTDYGLRLMRGNSGENTNSSLQHRGTGNFYFNLQDGSNSVIFNEGSYDTDFRVESNDNTHMLFVDGGANTVGINASLPRTTLHVNVDGATGGTSNDWNNDKWFLITDGSGASDSGFGITHTAASGTWINSLDPYTAWRDIIVNGDNFKYFQGGTREIMALGYNEAVFNDGGTDLDFRVESDSNTHMLFVDAGNNCVSAGGGNSPAGSNWGFYAEGQTKDTNSNTYVAAKLASASYFDSGEFTTILGMGVEKGAYWSKGGMGYTRNNSYDVGYLGFYVNGVTSQSNLTLADEVLRLTPAEVVVNDRSRSTVDFRVESNNKANMLVVDASLDFVGIETSTRINGSSTAGVLTTAGGICIETQVSGGNGYYGLWLHNNAGTQTGYIYNNGSSTSYNTASDVRLKQNILDAEDAGSLIDDIQVRSFDWKETGEHQRFGMVAQELQTVVPEAVHQPKDADVMMGVDYSKLVPMLIKEIQSLRARVADLES